MAFDLTRQPQNTIAPFKFPTDTYRGFDQKGDWYGDVWIQGTLHFPDGSFMNTAGSGLPAVIDEGVF